MARIILKGERILAASQGILLTLRIVLADMQISVKETTVFSVFHPDAHDLFNTCSDLKKVAWELWDPKRRLNDEVSLTFLTTPLRSDLRFPTRKKQCSSSVPLHLCFASVQHAESRTQ